MARGCCWCNVRQALHLDFAGCLKREQPEADQDMAYPGLRFGPSKSFWNVLDMNAQKMSFGSFGDGEP